MHSEYYLIDTDIESQDFFHQEDRSLGSIESRKHRDPRLGCIKAGGKSATEGYREERGKNTGLPCNGLIRK
jgi:hypothetical protein